MSTDPVSQLLERTLEDLRLDDAERDRLSAMLKELELSPAGGMNLAERMLDLAIRKAGQPESKLLLRWMGDVLRTLHGAMPRLQAFSSVHFSPGGTCREAILDFILGARVSLDLCIFTITDDQLAYAIAGAATRGVAVRIVTDAGKMRDEGSDAGALRRMQGVAVRTLGSPPLMHNKFALADGMDMLTGSYNWTNTADARNFENVLRTNDPAIVRAYSQEFERLWVLAGQAPGKLSQFR